MTKQAIKLNRNQERVIGLPILSEFNINCFVHGAHRMKTVKLCREKND